MTDLLLNALAVFVAWTLLGLASWRVFVLLGCGFEVRKSTPDEAGATVHPV